MVTWVVSIPWTSVFFEEALFCFSHHLVITVTYCSDVVNSDHATNDSPGHEMTSWSLRASCRMGEAVGQVMVGVPRGDKLGPKLQLSLEGQATARACLPPLTWWRSCMGSGIWNHVIQELGSASERLRRRATHQTSTLFLSWVNLPLDLLTQLTLQLVRMWFLMRTCA